MNKHYKTLELHKILDMLSEQAGNDETRRMIAELEPETDIDKVKESLKKTEDAFELSVKFGTPPFYNFKDVRGSLQRAQSGSSLSLRELLDICSMLKQIRGLTDYHASCGDVQTVLDPLFEELSPNKWLEDKIQNAILTEDEIADTASAELANIRRKIAQAGVRIRESLDKMVRSADVQKSLMDNIVTVRDGRYVLPVKAEYKGNVRGIVHASSATGSTLFIEPEAVVEANNDIRVLQGREQEEIERIIAELSSDCAACAETMKRDYFTCAELNLYFAKSNLGAKMRATVPEISDDGILELKKARHPLIDAEKVVPVDISVGRDYSTLIVTGPNTGGKTVLLKTAGLLTAMAMCGMMVPAGDGTKISVFRHILVDIGDMQSIEQSLSTFSSHMSNVVQILRTADESSLILIDELGSGTDPVEGAALAVSIIEALIKKGSRIFVTTHYQELKLFAIERENVENASCEFDVKTLQPTYRLIIGSPGKSNAFSISSKLGIPREIIDEAKSLVSADNRRFEEVVAQLEASRRALDRQNTELARLRKEAEEKEQALEKEREEFEARKDDEFEKARTQAMRIVENCRMQSEKLLDELSDIRKERNKEAFDKRSSAAKSMSRSSLDKMYDEANPVRKRELKEYKPPRPYKRGDNVIVADIGKKGILASDPDSSGNVFVQVGIMKTKTNISHLRLAEEDKVTVGNKKKSPASRVSKVGVSGKTERKSSLELDIRGCAIDEGIHEVDRFIDNAVMLNAGIVTIIHGKGTGLLRQGIQRHLRSHPSVKSFRNGVFGEGEDGVTVVELK
ncbi:MAG: endonuclease MutS2 [Oscillospiraceae bacterium]|nr:endonuclease MutS2 [Oscillospiraceae bacterium]